MRSRFYFVTEKSIRPRTQRRRLFHSKTPTALFNHDPQEDAAAHGSRPCNGPNRSTHELALVLDQTLLPPATGAPPPSLAGLACSADARRRRIQPASRFALRRNRTVRVRLRFLPTRRRSLDIAAFKIALGRGHRIPDIGNELLIVRGADRLLSGGPFGFILLFSGLHRE